MTSITAKRSSSQPAKTCEELFAGTFATILGNPDETVTGLAYRSDAVQPGDAFFCIVGFSVDGHSFAQDAIDRGASIIVAERKLYLADATNVTVVVVPDSRRAMALAACAFYDDPSHSFDLVGVTGTNGKTTTTYLVENIVQAAGQRCGVIGTVGVKIGDKQTKAERTTPESPDLQKTFAEMRDAGCQVVAMEVSSHALDLGRVLGSRFAVTAFTNLTQDHLDYHHTFDAYFEAKALLFGKDYPARRVISIGDSWGRELAARCRESGDACITTGFDKGADIHPIEVAYSDSSTAVTLSVQGETFAFTYALVGRFNVENIMTAFGIGLMLDIPAQTIIDALAGSCVVPGRLERVESDVEDLSVFVDYAHTPDALTKALASVKALTDGHVIVVFGCGGDRDSTKRPIMGRAALEADLAIVTSDNPRTEDPSAIIDDIIAGMAELDNSKKIAPVLSVAADALGPSSSAAYTIVEERAEAIRFAVDAAKKGDVVLIAGKGHEDYQVIGTQKHHFDDREEAAAALALRAARAEDAEEEA